MSTYWQKISGQFCGKFKSNQNRQIWYRLAINKLCISYFVSSYQDKNNEIIKFTKKKLLCPQLDKMYWTATTMPEIPINT